MLRPQTRRRTRKWRPPAAPPVTPPAPGLIFGHDFNDGTIGGLTQWGGYTAQPVSVIPDPTGSGRGMVAKVVYARPANSPGGRDVNGGLYLPASNPVIGKTFGDRIYLEHDLWLPRYPGGVPTQPHQDQRKLWYLKFGAYNPDTQNMVRVGGWYPVLWGNSEGSGMELRFQNEDNITFGPPFVVEGLAQLRWEEWYRLGMEFLLNHEGAADGRVRLWLNDVLLMDLVDFELVRGGSVGSAANIYEWGIGNQEQWAEDETVDMNDYRLVDNIRFLSARPADAGSDVPSTLLFAKDFSSGAWAPISTPTRGSAADYSIVPDPTGSGRGLLARIHYHRDSTSDGELDKNRAFTLNHVAQLVGPGGHTYGSRGYVRGDVYVPVGTRSGFAPQFDQRKLMYPKFGDWENGNLRHDWGIILDGRTATDPRGPGMDMRIVSGTRASAGYADFREHAYGVAEFSYDAWHTVEMEWRLNDAGLSNGWLRVWLDGVLVFQRISIRLVDPHVNGLPRDYLWDFEVGDQQQGNTDPNLVPNPSIFDADRYWDNIEVRTARAA